MNALKVLCLCLLVVSAVRSEDAETKEDAKSEKAETQDDEGICLSKESCKESAEADEEAPGTKYTEEKQEKPAEEKKDKSEGGDDQAKDKTEGEEETVGNKEEGDKKKEGPKNGEETPTKEDKDKSEGGDDQTKEETKGGKETVDKDKEGDEKKEEVPKKGEEERHLVKIEVLEEGKFCDRLKATNEDSVTVHLRGFKASDGSEFITTYKEDGSEGLSSVFRMGVGDSIKGLELGIIGMCIAELRRLTVPASLVRNGREEFKGDRIPRGEDLIFEVRLLGAVPNYQKGLPNMFKQMDTNEDGLIQRQELYDSIVGDESMFPRGAPVVDELTDEQLGMVDKNKDGVIQWEEFHLPKWDDL